MKRQQILVVQNARWEGPGLVGSHAKSAGLGLSVAELFRKPKGAALPMNELEEGDYAAVVSLGSPATAYLPETNPHHEELVRLFRAVRKLGIPSFDICYSMQLFCVAHGGKVTKNPQGKEVGFREVRPTEEGITDPVIGPVGAYTTLQWHGDIVEQLPSGSTRLASSKKTKNQVAVVDGIHYLFQSDGQAASPAMVRSWMRHDAKWATQGTGIRANEVIREATEHEAYFRNTFLRIFSNFLALAVSPKL
jgi:GMP synthase (glutamine-hydrolysing)